MIRWILHFFGIDPRTANTERRSQRTNEMLTKLNGRQQDVERQTRRIRRTGDPISKIYAGQHPQEEDQS